jgi:hypothetical protein
VAQFKDHSIMNGKKTGNRIEGRPNGNGAPPGVTARSDGISDLVDEGFLGLAKEMPTLRFRGLELEELLNRPPKQWLVDQWFGAGDVVMIYGGPGSGKTFVVIDLIFAMCMGKQFAERFDVPCPLTVAYCAGEGLSGLPQRFAAAAVWHRASTLPGFVFYETVPTLFYGERDAVHLASIERFVTEWQAEQAAGRRSALDVLVIDTLHSATPGADENSARDAGRILQLVRLAIQDLGCAVILVHHANRAGTGERGSSAFRGAMDCMVETRKISDTGTKAVIQCAKLKDGVGWKDQTFDLVAVGDTDSVRVWWDEPNDSSQVTGKKVEDKAALRGEMERYAGVRFTVKSMSEVIAKGENYTRNLLAELEKSGDVKRELSDPTKSYSPRNPWVYFVESVQEAAEDGGLHTRCESSSVSKWFSHQV